MTADFSNSKTALVTGGANGLGRAFVQALFTDGYEVHVVDIDEDGLSQLHREVSGDVQTYLLDLSDRDAVVACIKQLANNRSFDRVILNAGISATGNFEKIPMAAHRKLMETNLLAPLLLVNGLLASQSVAEGGQITFISSLSHLTGYPGAASYAASKDGLAIYAKSLAKALKKTSISVHCAFPGPIRTEHARRHAPKDTDETKRADPDRVAAAILRKANSGRFAIYPDFRSRSIAAVGKLFPDMLSNSMRKLIFEKLEDEVY